METFGNVVTWLTANAQIISIIVAILTAVIPAVWTFVRYLDLKNKELQHERFKIYHELIRNLVEPDASGQRMSIDRQIAVVYELRNFKEYFEVTLRMLEGLRETWNDPRFERLRNEIDHAIQYISENSRLQPNKQKQPGA